MVLISIALTFLSCGDDSSDNTGETTKPTTGGADTEQQSTTSKYDIKDNLGEYDFDGYVFRNIARQGNHIEQQEQTGEVLNDAVFFRNRAVEERFNIKFAETIAPTDAGAATAAVRNSILTNDKAYDIVTVRGPDIFTIASEGLIHPISNLPYLDYDKPYWDEWLLNQFSIMNKNFMAAGAYDYRLYGAQALLFNKQLARNLGIGDIYSLVRQGKWTFDKFEEFSKMAIRDLNGDAVITEDDQVGFVGIARILVANWTVAGGVKSIEKDADDIPYLNALDPKFIDVWLRMANMMVTNDAWFHNVANPDLHPNPLWDSMFRDNKALFYQGGLGSAQTFRDMENDFGIVPLPKFNEEQENHNSPLGWIETVTVPIYADDDDLDRTSIILEALASESYRKVTPVYVDLVLGSKFIRDDESEEMIDIILNNRTFDWGDPIFLLRDEIFRHILVQNSDTIVSRVQASESGINAKINKMVDAFSLLD